MVGGVPSLKKNKNLWTILFTISDSWPSRREVQLLQFHEIVEIQPESGQPAKLLNGEHVVQHLDLHMHTYVYIFI